MSLRRSCRGMYQKVCAFNLANPGRIINILISDRGWASRVQDYSHTTRILVSPEALPLTIAGSEKINKPENRGEDVTDGSEREGETVKEEETTWCRLIPTS